MASKETLSFQPLGRGVSYAVEGSELVCRIPVDPKSGVLSGGGKMKLVASTGGWTTIPGTDNLRINVMAGYKV